MRVSFLSVLVVTVLCQVAYGQIETQDLAVEVAPTNIDFPSAPGGAVSFQPCSDICEAPFVRVTLSAGTRYTLNGKTVKFDEFRQQFALRKGEANGYALVTYNVESKVVLGIAFSH
jgi:hypothetical protein